MNMPMLIPDWLPTPANIKFHDQRNVLDDVVYGIIERAQSVSKHLTGSSRYADEVDI